MTPNLNANVVFLRSLTKSFTREYLGCYYVASFRTLGQSLRSQENNKCQVCISYLSCHSGQNYG